MKVKIYDTVIQAAADAAAETAQALTEAITDKGSARIVLSTGASQFAYLDALVQQNVDWKQVEMFHLDEYLGLGEEHGASFVRYLKERFVSRVPLKKTHFICGTADVDETVRVLTAALNESPVDVGIIGIGENAHIAFNDPPADFEDPRAYKVVDLDEKCRMQQVREGWFPNLETVCKQAITMTCRQIMKCKKIISFVPYAVKAAAIRDTLMSDLTPMVPATLLKSHNDFSLYVDADSIALTPESVREKYRRI